MPIEVPLLLCFDDRILTGAGVTILSAVRSARADTRYRFEIVTAGLDPDVEAALTALVADTGHEMRFHRVAPERVEGLPRSRGSWTEVVYFRLLAAEILPQVARVIYSDVDVFVARDLSELMTLDLGGAEWGGVIAERNAPGTVMHRHFPENPNPYIHFSGLMVMDLDRMRASGAVERYLQNARTFGPRLKFFDLDLVNLSSTGIAAVPLAYCVLEDVYESDDVTRSMDWRYLRSAYGAADLDAARADPAILHFAGPRGKPWQRRDVAVYYADLERALPDRLRRPTWRDFRKRWLTAKGRRRLPARTPSVRRGLFGLPRGPES